MSHSPRLLRNLLHHLLHRLAPLVGVVLFGASLWAIAQQLQQYQWRDIWLSLRAIPQTALLRAIGLTLLNYWIFTSYDTLAVRYVRHPLPYRKTAFAAVIATAISNSVGLALLSGSAIRYRLYRVWQFSSLEIAHLIAFCNLSFWLGLFAVAGVMFTLKSVTVPAALHLPFQSVRALGGLFLAGVMGYIGWNFLSRKPLKIGSLEFPHLAPPLALLQILVGSCDWILAAAIFYTLLPASSTLSYPLFFSAYLLGQIAGMISNIPGGLGVFETVLLLLLTPAIPTATVFGVLLAYRAIYYLLPLLLAALSLGVYEWQRWRA